jgi:hypothetical protein
MAIASLGIAAFRQAVFFERLENQVGPQYRGISGGATEFIRFEEIRRFVMEISDKIPPAPLRLRPRNS